jgi:polysaccharide deacetylase 2 family uncharacterized protein YibQ
LTLSRFSSTLESVSGPRKNSKNLIIVLYLLLSVSCLIWLAAYMFYFRQDPAPSGNPATDGLARLEETGIPPPEDSPATEGAENPAAAPPVRETPVTAAGQAASPANASHSVTASAPERPQKPRGATASSAPELSRGKIAVILDDAGYQNDLLKSFTDFAGKLTIAVLPALPGSAEAARIIAAAGKETMLHLPMQPQHGENPGPQAILTSMDDQTVIRLTKKHIDSLPGLKGVNNHMGSLATEDPRIMSLVLGVIRERGLFFIDSRTTAASEGPRLATRMGIPFRERSVFLDNVQDRQSIRGYFETGKQIAAKQGWALMIGHVWCAELAEILPRLYEEAQAQGYEFLFVSELLGKSGMEKSGK